MAEASESGQSKINERIRTLGSSLLVRVCLAWLVIQFPCYFIAQYLYSGSFARQSDTTMDNIVASLERGPVSEKTLRSIASKHGLTWLYATNLNGSPEHKALIPQGVDFTTNKTREVKVSGKVILEDVVEYRDHHFLHAGFDTGFRTTMPGRAETFPVAFSLLWFGLANWWSLVAIYFWLNRPISRLSKLSKDEFLNPAERKNRLDAKQSITELKQLTDLLKELGTDFDEQSQMIKSLEEERESLKKANEKLKQDVLFYVKQSHKRLSEFAGREEEEKLVKVLASEIKDTDELVDICNKSMDQLHEQFPAGIEYTAFFLPDKNGNFVLSCHLGLLDIHVSVLKALPLHRLCEDCFEKGAVFPLKANQFEDYGIDALNRYFEAITFVPIMYNSRQIALLAVCFTGRTQEHQEELRRVFKKLSELVARAMNTHLVLKEELTAARTDALTGVYNKKYFQEIGADLFKTSMATKSPVAFMFLDGDHFKQINDTYGHQIGDQMLAKLGSLLRTNTRHKSDLKHTPRKSDFVFRWGGEEFLIVLDGTDLNAAKFMAERLRSIVDNKADWPGGIEKWTVSIGVAVSPDDGNSIDEILEAADKALYHCKKVIGRNKVAVFSEIRSSAESNGQANADAASERSEAAPALIAESAEPEKEPEKEPVV